MKKFWKIFGFIALGFIAIVYLGFLFVLPNAVDINKYTPDVKAL